MSALDVRTRVLTCPTVVAVTPARMTLPEDIKPGDKVWDEQTGGTWNAISWIDIDDRTGVTRGKPEVRLAPDAADGYPLHLPYSIDRDFGPLFVIAELRVPAVTS